MNKEIVRLLHGSESWGLDLYIWHQAKLFAHCKTGDYRILWNDPLLTVLSTLNFVRDKWGYEDYEVIKIFHYLEISSIKIKHRLNIIFQGSFVNGFWTKD